MTRLLSRSCCVVLFFTQLISSISAHALPLAASPSASPSSTTASMPFGMAAFEGSMDDQPTFVDADSLTLNAEKRVFEYKGNVIVRRGEVTLTAQIVEGNYLENNQIKTITARNNVTITKVNGLIARGQRAVYDAFSETVILTDNPSVDQDGSSLSADKITVFLRENRSEASGQVKVKLIKKPPQALPSPSASPSAEATHIPTN